MSIYRLSLTAGKTIGENEPPSFCSKIINPSSGCLLKSGKKDTTARSLNPFLNGRLYPVRDKNALGEQNPSVRRAFVEYASFATAEIDRVYPGEFLDKAKRHTAEELRSVVLRKKEGKYETEPLPVEAQFSTVRAIITHDFTMNGNQDILMAGNRHFTEVKSPRSDASLGLLLENGQGHGWRPIRYRHSGFFAPVDARAMALLSNKNGWTVVVTNNDGEPQFFSKK